MTSERRWEGENGEWGFGCDYSAGADFVFAFAIAETEPAFVGPVDIRTPRYRRLLEGWAEYYGADGIEVHLFPAGDGNKELDDLFAREDFRKQVADARSERLIAERRFRLS